MSRKKTSESSEQQAETAQSKSNLLGLTADIVASYLAHNQVPASELPAILRRIHDSLGEMSGQTPAATANLTPAIPAKKSVSDEFIICLEDGKKLRTLKRYLKTQYNLTPEQYRAKWGLPRDYPMVAPAYARLRSAFAKKIGLGRVPAGRGKRKTSA
ncbi:MAG: transcriptional regulator [Alphaproteobacteria bacterium]|nr:transcriptional regulator [Alphaproteobacteria bacterium]